MAKRRKKSAKITLLYLISTIPIVLMSIFIGYRLLYLQLDDDNPFKHIAIDKQDPIITVLQRDKAAKSKKRKELWQNVSKLSKKSKKTEIGKSTKIDKKESPKLVIIVDDVHTKRQLKKIRSLPYSITPSIFPPYSLSPDTPKLVKNLRHYMVHLPMESHSRRYNRQTGTLMHNATEQKIRSSILNIKRLFPDAKIINNHTGSVFTSDKRAMLRLYSALKEEGFYFLDSFTTASSKAKKAASIADAKYFRRDIFLDNKQRRSYIRGQLKRAVKLAKKKGYAIAICHPHPATIRTLASSKDILKHVSIIYMDELVGQRVK